MSMAGAVSSTVILHPVADIIFCFSIYVMMVFIAFVAAIVIYIVLIREK